MLASQWNVSLLHLSGAVMLSQHNNQKDSSDHRLSTARGSSENALNSKLLTESQMSSWKEKSIWLGTTWYIAFFPLKADYP